MPLHSIPESELRNHCKRNLEGLELWLRRLIDNKLSAALGQNYLEATRPDGSRVLRAELVRALNERRLREPERFARPIDAALLDEQISIICNPVLYETYFKDALRGVFPTGAETARIFLERLIVPRNALSHANSISIHDAYRVLCYATDVIEGLKSYYTSMNTAQLYNAPTVVRVWDSLGNVVQYSGSNRPLDGPAMIDYSRDPSKYLRCGDTLSIEIDVDPTFNPEDYDVNWLIANMATVTPQIRGRKFNLLLTEQYVSTRFCAVCRVTSKKDWHRLGYFDDQIDIAYKVLPPI